MARLPTPGSDDGTWGQILNEYLLVSLTNDGLIKSAAVTNDSIASSAAIDQSKISGLVAALALKANSASLATVATTGNYSDLSGTPTPFAMPAGAIIDYAGSSAPTGWLLCDGTAISRTTYAALFSAIGTTYGTGNGSTTFNLPNSIGRVTVGKSSAGTFATLGSTGGSETHTHTLSEAAHAQIRQNSGSSGLILSRRITVPTWTADFTLAVTNAGDASTTSASTGVPLAGSTDAGSTLQPYLTTNKIIKI